jgi:hypothetical protein
MANERQISGKEFAELCQGAFFSVAGTTRLIAALDKAHDRHVTSALLGKRMPTAFLHASLKVFRLALLSGRYDVAAPVMAELVRYEHPGWAIARLHETLKDFVVYAVPAIGEAAAFEILLSMPFPNFDFWVEFVERTCIYTVREWNSNTHTRIEKMKLRNGRLAWFRDHLFPARLSTQFAAEIAYPKIAELMGGKAFKTFSSAAEIPVMPVGSLPGE